MFPGSDVPIASSVFYLLPPTSYLLLPTSYLFLPSYFLPLAIRNELQVWIVKYISDALRARMILCGGEPYG